MPNLLELHEYAVITNNEDAVCVTLRYIRTSFTTEYYVLGGMIALKLSDNITLTIIKEVQSLLYYSEGQITTFYASVSNAHNTLDRLDHHCPLFVDDCKPSTCDVRPPP